jgi:GH25 family lysozyme M1 (1,4-beta-N-acetylmuramidase)
MGAYTPSDTVLKKGIDVSSYNGTLSWSSISTAGVDFAILRAGTSGSGEDSLFAYNYRNAKAYGLEVGAYYYVEARSVEEILTYAQKLKTILNGKKFEYPIYLDIEKDSLGAELGKDLLTQMAIAFIEDLQADGYFAALYTNNNWLENFYHKDTLLPLYDVWYARYIPTEKLLSPVWDLEKYGPAMGMWQYTQEGTLEGVASDIPFDINLCYKDYPTIIKRHHYNGY